MTLAPGDRLYFYSDLAKAGVTYGLWSCTDYSVSGARWETYMAGISEPVFFPVGYRVVDMTPANAPLMSLAGVRYFVFEGSAPRFADPALIGAWREIARDGEVVAVENPDALPRAFVVPRAVVEPDADRVLARLREIDLRREAVVETAGPALSALAPEGDPGTARIVSYEPNRVVVESDAPSPGLLVLTDQYDPGWRATVDGATAPVLRADYLFRGIPVPAGTHRVELVYRPLSFTVGAVGSLLSVAAVVALLLVPARIRR
jgi:hypothetical protein